MRHWTERGAINWVDLLFLLFLVGLALLPPRNEIHKQEILLAIGVFQLLEARIVRSVSRRGQVYSVVIKVLLATLLLDHSGGELSINSSYYPIYYLPIMTAAMYFGPLGTLFWTLVSVAAYCSYLLPVLQVKCEQGTHAGLLGAYCTYVLPALRVPSSEEFTLTDAGKAELGIRILFFFLVGMVVNRFVRAYHLQTERLREVAEGLEVANRNLRQAQAEARRSERLAALGQLSAGLAHEIRNPLGVIKGSAEMLKQKLAASDALAVELAGYVYSEANRLSALVSRFLDFARPVRLELRRQQIVPLLDRALAIVFEQPVAAHVTLQKEYADVPMVLVDEQFSEQVFINLAQNACEAMEPKGGLLKVQVSPQEKNGTQGVAVVLEDTGPGVPAELREQIFNPFVTTKATGVGLGLSIVSKIMDDQGGSIRLADGNGAGKGARFELFFPSDASPDEAGRQASQAEGAKPASQTSV